MATPSVAVATAVGVRTHRRALLWYERAGRWVGACLVLTSGGVFAAAGLFLQAMG